MAKFDINKWRRIHLNEEEMKDESNPKWKTQQISSDPDFGVEIFDRMESSVKRTTLHSFQNNLNELVKDWEEEGFEKDDILKYIDFLIEGGW